MGRTNPIHTMLRTGTDAYVGVLDKRGIRAADVCSIAAGFIGLPHFGQVSF
jgi:hypothetical protein